MKNRVIIQWHITHKCNLRCKHCYQEEYCSDLTEEKLQMVISRIVEYLAQTDSVGHINLTGGEPLVHPFFWKVVQWIREESRIKSFGLLTNGTLLQRDTAALLSKEKKLSFVQVSIDGDQGTHDAIRGEGNLALTEGAIKELHRKKIQTMVSFTAGKENYQDLEAVVNRCKKQKVDRFWTDRVVPIGNAGKNEADPAEQLLNQEEFTQYIQKLYGLYEREKKNPFSHLTVHANRALQFMGNSNELGGYHCGAGKNLLVIIANGDLMPCRRLNLVLGNLLDQSIAELLEEKKDVIDDIHKVPEACSHCRYVRKCMGGAKCMTYAVHGDFQHRDPNCPFEE